VPVTLGVSLTLPAVACVPLQAPLAAQAVALVEDQVTTTLWPIVMDAGLTDSVNVGAGAVLTASDADALALPPAPVHVNV
jgi:hypothetical protein